MMRHTVKLLAITALLFLLGCDKTNENKAPVSVITYTPYFTTSESSLCGGEIEFNETVTLADFGLCWSQSAMPTLEDDTYSSWGESTSVDGVQWFTHTVEDLEPNTTYFCRAYATCATGETYYGDTKTFFTSTDESEAYYLTFNVRGVTFRMVRVEVDGSFFMGAQADDPEKENYDPDAISGEKPVHEVSFRHSYYIGETETPFDLWWAVTGYNPGRYWGEYTPANGTSYYMITQHFLPALNALTGRNFRLPTEAEWEFAARGANQGRHYRFAGSNDFDEVSWCIENSGDEAHRMAQKAPNERGLYDMAGNIAEICEDWNNYYSSERQLDPVGTYLEEYPQKIMRGGGYHFDGIDSRNTRRGVTAPDGSYINVGFRLVLDP